MQRMGGIGDRNRKIATHPLELQQHLGVSIQIRPQDVVFCENLANSVRGSEGRLNLWNL
jgi:hypothetical protein